MTPDSRLLPGRLLTTNLLGNAGAVEPEEPRPTVDYMLGDPGHPAKEPTLLVALVDDSGSVTAPGGSDPLSNRYCEMAHAMSVVAKRGSRRERAAVLHFDTPCAGDIAPTPLLRRNLALFGRGLQTPPDTRGTSQLLPGLRRAASLAAGHPNQHTTLVVLSDFLLLDPDPAEALAELTAFPGDVHAVVLGSHVAEDAWAESIHVTHIGYDDPPGAVARALFSSLITHRPGSQAAPVPAS